MLKTKTLTTLLLAIASTAGSSEAQSTQEKVVSAVDSEIVAVPVPGSGSEAAPGSVAILAPKQSGHESGSGFETAESSCSECSSYDCEYLSFSGTIEITTSCPKATQYVYVGSIEISTTDDDSFSYRTFTDSTKSLYYLSCSNADDLCYAYDSDTCGYGAGKNAVVHITCENWFTTCNLMYDIAFMCAEIAAPTTAPTQAPAQVPTTTPTQAPSTAKTTAKTTAPSTTPSTTPTTTPTTTPATDPTTTSTKTSSNGGQINRSAEMLALLASGVVAFYQG
jgi:hypothetical protein